ncbi:cytochrome P450 [Dyella nitratireducens]|uniref:cytochrome P450 n=1 Tax=Dyella nitratireducens TaxID=1849580 RepID=UPI001666A9AA
MTPYRLDPWHFIRGPKPEQFDCQPFGIGPHVCIGAQLAMTEASIVLAAVAAGQLDFADRR